MSNIVPFADMKGMAEAIALLAAVIGLMAA